MSTELDRRGFVKTAVSAVAATAAATSRPDSLKAGAPAVMTQGAVQPVVISDISGIRYKNGGPLSAVEKAYQMMAQGADVLDALIAGVNIPELDPEEQGIGYGGLPNAEGVVQLDSCCIHGPKKWAGGVAALEGVRTPSLVAQAVMEYTDHHLLVGKGAQDFAKNMGFEVEADLNTEKSRELWLEWKRRVDPSHYLDPKKRSQLGYEAGLQMLREGLIEESHLWGTINCNGINAAGEICGVTTTSGLAWKIPGRTGDSPILGAGLYVDGDIGAAGSTGRGEANLFNLSSCLIVESMRHGMHPKDAGIEALQRIKSNTVEQRLLNERGLPSFNVRFFVLNARGDYAGVSMYLSAETTYAVCTESGAEERPLEGLLPGTPTD
jgi:N4-(beta-N-acetylglucosaminyl)-L-asparaginase